MKNFLIGLLAVCAMTTGAALAANDVGPKADVAAVRAAVSREGNNVFGVHVLGNYAFVMWLGKVEGSGGEAYKRVSGERWTRILFEGGVTGMSQLEHAGIPAATARKLCAEWPTGYTPCGNF
jgi:hypothetical protein